MTVAKKAGGKTAKKAPGWGDAEKAMLKKLGLDASPRAGRKFGEHAATIERRETITAALKGVKSPVVVTFAQWVPESDKPDAEETLVVQSPTVKVPGATVVKLAYSKEQANKIARDILRAQKFTVAGYQGDLVAAK